MKAPDYADTQTHDLKFDTLDTDAFTYVQQDFAMTCGLPATHIFIPDIYWQTIILDSVLVSQFVLNTERDLVLAGELGKFGDIQLVSNVFDHINMKENYDYSLQLYNEPMQRAINYKLVYGEQTELN